MKKFIYLALAVFFASCSKEQFELTPTSNKSSTPTTIVNTLRDSIDQSFFVNGWQPEIICLKMGIGDMMGFEVKPPKINGSYETVFHCEWSWIRTKNGGVKSCIDDKITIKPMKGSNVVLRIWGERLGTPIKSDVYLTQYKIK